MPRQQRKTRQQRKRAAKTAAFCQSVRAKRLALRELEAAAGFRAAVLLTLDGTAVAGQEAFMLQGTAQAWLVIGQGLADAMTDRTGLAGETAADHRANDIELADAIDDAEGLVDDHPQHRTGEIGRHVATIDGDLAAARLNPDAGDGVLALAGGIGTALGIDLTLVLRGSRRGGQRRGLGSGAEIL